MLNPSVAEASLGVLSGPQEPQGDSLKHVIAQSVRGALNEI